MIKISIITPTFNSADTLRDCLDSVLGQKINVEHIIIDGGSNDRTLSIAQSYKHINKIISEEDCGIYDAMNKGIALASGEVIGILNSDDFYADENVICKVIEVFEDENIDSCYGDLLYVDKNNTSKIIRAWISSSYRKNAFFWGWMPPHPTFFVRSSIYEKYGSFNLKFCSAADYELMLRFLLKHKISSKYINKVLVKMRTGGASNISIRNRLKANKMDRLAWTENGLKPHPWTTYLKPISKIKQFFV